MNKIPHFRAVGRVLAGLVLLNVYLVLTFPALVATHVSDVPGLRKGTPWLLSWSVTTTAWYASNFDGEHNSKFVRDRLEYTETVAITVLINEEPTNYRQALHLFQRINEIKEPLTNVSACSWMCNFALMGELTRELEKAELCRSYRIRYNQMKARAENAKDCPCLPWDP